MPNDYSEMTDEQVLKIYEETRAVAGEMPEGVEAATYSSEESQRNYHAEQELERRGWRIEPGRGWVGPEE